MSAKRAAALEAIILYKLAKAVLDALLGAVATWFVIRGAEAQAATLAEILLESTSRPWALRAARLLVRGATGQHVTWAAIVAFGDAIVSAIEGLALRAGKWWAPWLVVVATGSLLPWELVEIFAHPGWVRVAVFVLNLVMVLYLLRKAARDRDELAHRPTVDSQAGGP